MIEVTVYYRRADETSKYGDNHTYLVSTTLPDVAVVTAVWQINLDNPHCTVTGVSAQIKPDILEPKGYSIMGNL